MTPALMASALVMGLLGSTHCVVMCGGVVGALSGGLTQLGKKPQPRRALGMTLAYNVGRVGSYALAGAIAGSFGALVERIPALHGAALGLRIGAGLLMLGLGLYLAGLWGTFASIERVGLPLWRRLEPLARRILPVRSVPAALALGAVWGWMPCGLVYAALGLALGTGSSTGGALTMVAFGLGTAPMLLGMGALAVRFAELARIPWVKRAAGLVVITFGVFHVVAASAQIARTDTSDACCAAHGVSRE